MSEQVILRAFRDGDLDDVIELRTKVLHSKLSHTREKKLWYWKFNSNPFSSSRIPHAWVLEHEGKIVGSIEQVAVPMKVGEKIVIGYIGCDFAVQEKYRPYGVILANKFWRNRKIPFSMVTTTGEGVSDIHKVFGAKELMLGRYSWFRIVHSKNILRKLLDCRSGVIWKILSNGWLLSTISGLLDLVFKMKNGTKTYRRKLRIEKTDEFDSEFDKLWRSVSSHYDILIVRNSKYLRWRYIDYPFERPQIFSAHDDAGNMRGFAVVQVSVSDAMTHAGIMELFTEPSDKVAQKELLQAVLTCANKHKVDIILAGSLPLQVCRLLKRNLFWRRKTMHSKYLFKTDEVTSFHGSKREGNWFVSRGDYH